MSEASSKFVVAVEPRIVGRRPANGISLACLGLSLLAAVGCGGGKLATYPAKGRVLFADGQPVPGGTVELSAQAAEAQAFNARGRIQSDGTFVLGTYSETDGAAAGEHTVIVFPMLPPDDADETKPLAPEYQIDERFRRYDQTPLRVTVKKDRTNEFELKVEHPAGVKTKPNP